MPICRRLGAYEYVEDAVGGATEPAVMRCRAGKEAFDVVVKFSWQQCPAAALVRELVGTTLAHRVGLAAAFPALINVPADFAAEIAPFSPRLAAKMRNSVAPAFGSIHLGGDYALCRSLQGLEPSLHLAALEIWAFDQLTLNPDRNPLKPNCLTNGVRIAVLDHEKSLNVAGIGGLVPAPWDSRWSPFPGHLFQGTVVLGGRNLDRLEAAWTAASTPESIDQLFSEVPESWGAANCLEIRSYLLDLGAHVGPAFKNLRKLMS